MDGKGCYEIVEIKEIFNSDEKSNICDSILRALPNWFGNEPSIVDYIEKVKHMPFFVAYNENIPVGFIAIKVHNPHTAEVCVMGILRDYHRQGIGKRLVECGEMYCKHNNMDYLTVKTLDESKQSKSYEKTRLFYLSVGFKPLEVFPLFWDKDNPCLFLIKSINK